MTIVDYTRTKRKSETINIPTDYTVNANRNNHHKFLVTHNSFIRRQERNMACLLTRNLRFKIRRGNYEIELDGDFDYVREKFEELLLKLK